MANALIHETSPYLLQHAHNPVNWHPWNEETLATAKDSGKMMIISIGYAACHWCHVMEKESFEDEEVAAIMNEHFFCIKVDREERPDVDQIYMDAAHLINGNGGWPLNALALPDAHPFFAGTYFPKKNWIELLNYFIDVFSSQKNKLIEQAGHVTKGIYQLDLMLPQKKEMEAEDLDAIALAIIQKTDMQWGGMQGNIKFPMPSIWEFMLEAYYFTSDIAIGNACQITLDKMAEGGIYDHIGGGFFRYSTDPQWHVPHFEKMLYDNAAMVSLYSHAYQVFPKESYKQVVAGTLAFVNAKLTHENGGFYSSLDADSEGEEGKYYVWSKREIDDVLGEFSNDFCTYYGITENGNWEYPKNIPDHNFGSAANLPEEQIRESIDLLGKTRENKIPPATDYKILTSWNALMANAYLDAYQVFAEESYFIAGKKNIDFLLKNVCKNDGSLIRNATEKARRIPGFLDDYAFVISTLIQIFQINFEQDYLQTAIQLYEYVLKNFEDPESDLFFYTDRQHHQLILRKKEISDNVIVSSNSEMAKVSWLLGHLTYNEAYKNKARNMMKSVSSLMQKHPQYHANWARVANRINYPFYEISASGKDLKVSFQELRKHFLPQAVMLGKNTEEVISSKALSIFVCQNKVCQLPAHATEDALQLIQKRF